MLSKQALTNLPVALRTELIAQYQLILQHVAEHSWATACIHGGRFCEVAYSIVNGVALGSFPTTATKPKNFVDACKKLENTSGLSRSFQILLPRMLLPMYEIRNNRNVGHVGGDVDSNRVDAVTVQSMSSWVMAELVRYFHDLSLDEAQIVVDSIVDIQTPLVWQTGENKRVLDPKMDISSKMLVLLATETIPISESSLMQWLGAKNRPHFLKQLAKLTLKLQVEHDKKKNTALLTPLGAKVVRELIRKRLVV